MQLIYYSHSYRPADDDINEFFQELMVDEQLIPSLDPQSDRLNGAKPERHLRSTDAMVAVIPWRDRAPSEYIRWEVGRALRARRPQLVFVEDTLPDDLVPSGLLQRRFSRRRVLREVRDHRHAIRVLKAYIGNDPPPSYQPSSVRRRCILVGASQMTEAQRLDLLALLERLRYSPFVLEPGERLPEDLDLEQTLQRAALCIAFAEGLTPAEYYLLGIARAALTPTVLLTQNPHYVFHPVVPREYQPRFVARGDIDGLLRTIEAETDVFEEDYLELTEDKQIKRYKAFHASQLRLQRDGASQEARRQVFNFMGSGGLDMSQDKIQIGNVVGPVNIKSRLENVRQSVRNAPGWEPDRKAALQELVDELRASLDAVAGQRPAEADRISRSAESVVAEATSAKPDQDYLKVTAEGLKQAAKAVADIAPGVLAVAAKVAAFVAGLR
ncbi:MAG: hypothetical protein QM777_23810 [Pseudorhodoferax sp.]